ncbi:hypothetical protein RISK_004586 [Rhodopirellula islandica]|uniref:Uncharacterized protein n=1 Tax=Rhodopirellula islandica TaxID=595434 RepID=A0A0J1ECH3_RHOIS|nr:hypothetical protein RISK_004586 [Rhodopirellula islandica]
MGIHLAFGTTNDLTRTLSGSAGMINHNHVSRLGVRPGCA